VSKGPLKPIQAQSLEIKVESKNLTKEERIESILNNPTMTKTERRVAIEILMGERKPKGSKKKYASREERKAAAKVRAKERRAAKIARLPEAVRPSPRVKLEPEEKKAKRRERGQAKRANFREILTKAASSPEMLGKLEPTERFNLLKQVSRMRKPPGGVDTSGLPGMSRERKKK
jgi:hypothetical protein